VVSEESIVEDTPKPTSEVVEKKSTPDSNSSTDKSSEKQHREPVQKTDGVRKKIFNYWHS